MIRWSMTSRANRIKSASSYLATEGLISKQVDIDKNLKKLDEVTAELKAKAPGLLK